MFRSLAYPNPIRASACRSLGGFGAVSLVADNTQFIVIPRAENNVRLYVGQSVDYPEPLEGPSTISEFLESYRTSIFPDHDELAESTPIGPCATFPMNDAWTDTPVVPGGAVIGDAAGWSNPVTAQGLSITLRDARVLSEPLLDNVSWTPRHYRHTPWNGALAWLGCVSSAPSPI